jgi:hypothetical protein
MMNKNCCVCFLGGIPLPTRRWLFLLLSSLKLQFYSPLLRQFWYQSPSIIFLKIVTDPTIIHPCYTLPSPTPEIRHTDHPPNPILTIPIIAHTLQPTPHLPIIHNSQILYLPDEHS